MYVSMCMYFILFYFILFLQSMFLVQKLQAESAVTNYIVGVPE